MSVTKNGREIFNDSDINNPDIDGGTADNVTIGGSTPASGAFTQVKWAKGADVASANALTLGGDGNYYDITGTTSITSIGTLGVGMMVLLHFDGVLTFTHNATDLILPGGANITTAAGDEAILVEYDTGKWRCVNYTRASFATAFSDIKQAATTSATGVVELATTTEGIAGTDTERVMTPADDAAALAVIKNPLALAQGVHMTYATSGSGGIRVANNDDINFGTGDFFARWVGVFNTLSSGSLIQKYVPAGDGWIFQYRDTNVLRFWFQPGSANYKDTVNPEIVINRVYDLVAVFDESAKTVAVYKNGQLLDTLTFAAPTTASSAAAMYISGTSTTRPDSTTFHASVGNRALTAAEVLDLYRNGIDYADKYGSQTALSVNATDDMADDDSANWTATDATVAFDTDHYELTSVGGGTATLECACSGLTVGKNYRWDIKVKNGTDSSIVCTPLIRNNADDTTIATGTAGTTAAAFATISVEWEATETNNLVKLSCAAMTDTNNIELDDSAVYQIGATLALEPEGIQPAGAASQWLDSSTNKLNATLPAAGATNTRKIDFGRYVWSTAMTDDTTWTSILPAGFELERIILNNSTANTCTLRLGTSVGGTEMIASISVAASTFTTALSNKVASLTTDTTLYLSDTGDGWGSCSLTATLFFRRVN